MIRIQLNRGYIYFTLMLSATCVILLEDDRSGICVNRKIKSSLRKHRYFSCNAINALYLQTSVFFIPIWSMIETKIKRFACARILGDLFCVCVNHMCAWNKRQRRDRHSRTTRCGIVKAKANQCCVKRLSFLLVPLLTIVPKNTANIRWLSSGAIWRRGAWRKGRRIKNRMAGRNEGERRKKKRGAERHRSRGRRRRGGKTGGSVTAPMVRQHVKRQERRKKEKKITCSTWEKRNAVVGNLA